MTEVITKEHGRTADAYHQWFDCPYVQRANGHRTVNLNALHDDLPPCKTCIPNGEIDEDLREYKAECKQCKWFTVTDQLNAVERRRDVHEHLNGHTTKKFWRPKDPAQREFKYHHIQQQPREQPASINDEKEQRAIALLDAAGWPIDELTLVMKASESEIRTAIDRGKEVDIDL